MLTIINNLVNERVLKDSHIYFLFSKQIQKKDLLTEMLIIINSIKFSNYDNLNIY